MKRKYALAFGVATLVLISCAQSPSRMFPTLTPTPLGSVLTAESLPVSPTSAPSSVDDSNVPSAELANTGADLPLQVDATPSSEPAPLITDVPVATADVAAPSAASSTPELAAGWNTFVSAEWHVAVEYPAGWSVSEQAGSVTFTSPEGVTVQFSLASAPLSEPSDQARVPNAGCVTTTNAYGVAASICRETVSFTYQAEFAVKASDGSERRFWLVARTRDPKVFDAMVASVRPVP